MKHDNITSTIIKSALQVHTTLGCGFLESIYENSMKIECLNNNLQVKQQYPVNIQYKKIRVGDHRLDLLINDLVIVELKAIKGFEKIHFAQILHYLRATKKEVGLLLNFGRESLQIKRFII